MAQQALGPGTAVPRRRALFGLLDADGWAWASVKAFAWLIIIIFLLGYLPGSRLLLDRRPDGRPRHPRLVADQPLPADERDAALPGAGRRARAVGAVARRSSNLPQPRTDGAAIQVGTQILYIGGSDGTTASADVYVAPTVGTGNFDAVGRGPAAARAARRRERRLRRRQHLRHRRPRRETAPRPTRSSCSARTARPARSASGTPADDLDAARAAQRGRRGDHRRTGCCSSAVAMPTVPVDDDVEDAAQRAGRLGAWAKEAAARQRRRPTRRPSLIGDYLWLFGGSDANGPVGTVQRGDVRPRPPRKGCPRTRTRAS